VQTHQQIIDVAWLGSIQPLLLSRYPSLSAADLQQAHAYAYGGSAIQDIGYYPFGSAFFSDLTHYVRSGDFVLSLLHNAQNANELAFAIGALSHYLGDTYGHSLCVNPSVAIEFPALARRYGSVVTYEQDEHAHVRTEFAFDINAIAKDRMAPLAYLRHVGLKVPLSLLARSFFEVYGLHAYQIIGHREQVLRGYQFAVRAFLPRIAYAETLLHRHSMPPPATGPEVATLIATIRQAALENNWDQYRRQPGIGTYSLAGLIFILPKVGVLNNLAIRGPISFTQDLYIRSLNRTTDSLRDALKDIDHIDAVLPNRDLDTGAAVRPGSYRLTDRTYARLLGYIVKTPTQAIPPVLKHDLLAYYADPNAPIETRRHAKLWAQVQTNLATLATVPTLVAAN
jgi:hypothetical protein